MVKHYVVFIILCFHGTVHTMEQLIFKTNPSVKKQLKKAQQDWQTKMMQLDWLDKKQNTFLFNYREDVAEIVRDAGTQMCEPEKLNWLWGDNCYNDRKAIIKNIINFSQQNNGSYDFCQLSYQKRLNPLLDGIENKDDAFVEYLLFKGARPNQEILQKAGECKSDFIKKLLALFEARTDKKYELARIFYTRNAHADVVLSHKDLPSKELSSCLLEFIRYLGLIKGCMCWITVPHAKGKKIIPEIKKHAFQYYAGDNEHTEWVFPNGMPISIDSAALSIIIKKDDTLLVIEESKNRGKVAFPSGPIQKNELPRSAAQRILKGMTTVEAEPQQLQLCALLNRIKRAEDRSHSAHYFFAIDFTQLSGDELLVNSPSVVQSQYAFSKDIVEQQSVNNLNISPVIAALVKHIHEGRTHGYVQTVLDYRQEHKAEHERDNTDTMTIEFFAK